jgi:hypothetical protein
MEALKFSKLVVAVTLFLIIFYACEKKDDPQELLANGNVESGLGVPNAWVQAPTQTEFTLAWTDQESSSPENSLLISRNTLNITEFSYWCQTIYDNIPIGKTVTLKVKIKGNLTGDGVSIAIRGDDESAPVQFVTTEYFPKNPGSFNITGTFDWKEYSIQLPKIDTSVKSLLVYLIYLPNTTGNVYFDDISLTY